MKENWGKRDVFQNEEMKKEMRDFDFKRETSREKRRRDQGPISQNF